MKRSLTCVLMAVAAVMLLAVCGSTARSATIDDQIRGVMGRIQQRTPQLLALKNANQVGETATGLVEAIKAVDAAGKKLVADENTDRGLLFKLLAAKNRTTVKKVTDNFAKFRFRKAAPQHYFKGRNGKWLTKAQWLKAGAPGPFG